MVPPHSNIPDAVYDFHQAEDGYRFSVDSILLAEFVSAIKPKRVADFGAGCGVVGLSALEKGRVSGAKQVFFVEREPSQLECLRKNLALYQKRTKAELTVVATDWRQIPGNIFGLFGGKLDYVMVNPPYFKLQEGRLGSRPKVEVAKREYHGTLGDLVRVLRGVLVPEGRVALVLPAFRTKELFRLLYEEGLVLSRWELVPSHWKLAPSCGEGLGSQGLIAPRLVLAEAWLAAVAPFKN